MAQDRGQEKRRVQFVDRRQQVRFALILVFYALLYPIIFSFLTLVPPFSTMLTDPIKVEPLLRQFVGFNLSHWWIGLVTLALIGCLSVVFSHQIFGPMKRCERLLRQRLAGVSEGENLRLRKGDYFQELATLIERALQEDRPERLSKGPAARPRGDEIGHRAHSRSEPEELRA